MTHFVGSAARRDYWQFNLAALLCFFSMAQLALLSVILDAAGTPEGKIGIVLSSFALPVIVATMISGWLITYLGALRVVIIGLLFTFVGFASMHWTVAGSIAVASLSRVVQGIGFGFFLPAGTLYVKSRIVEDHQSYYVGIFTSMLVVPTLFAPALAEWYLRTYGVSEFFIVMSVPIITSILLCAELLKREVITARAPNTFGYLELLLDRRLLSPLLLILVTGAFWGFVTAFIALLLRKSNVVVAAFFTPLAVTMLISRFWLMRYIEPLHPATISATGLLLMSAAHATLLGSVIPLTAAIAGVLFGGGYSVIYPTAVVWAASRYSVEQTAKPVALISTVFNIGSFVTPLLGGYVIGNLGFSALILVLCVAALCIAMAVLVDFFS